MMTQITPIATHSAQAAVMQRLAAGRDVRTASSPGMGRAPADHLELSAAAAALLARMDELPEIRQGLVSQIRAQLASGSYELEISAKIESLLDRLAQEL